MSERTQTPKQQLDDNLPGLCLSMMDKNRQHSDSED